MTSLRLQNVKKSYEHVNVIHGIDLTINSGEFVVFVGPSGCGKSTLLRMIAGLEEISSGQLLIEEQDMTQQPATERGIAMVFQSYALYPNMTVRGNLAYPLEVMKKSKAEINEAIARTAARLHLTETARPPAARALWRTTAARGDWPGNYPSSAYLPVR